MTSLRPSPSFALPAIPFLASSPEANEVSPRPAAAIFGAPLDLTESFRSGAHGGPAAVRHMSDSLESYSPVLDRDLEDLKLLDLGDVDLAGKGVDEALELIRLASERAARTADLSIMLGGEHLASLAGFRGVRRTYPEAIILQVDAHLDMRADYEGNPFTHATWLYHVGQECGFQTIHQVGLRSGERAEWRLARERAAWNSTELVLPKAVRERMARRPVYVSIDIDVLDPAHAPGTGCPEPGGVTFRELAAFLHSLEGLNVVAIDVMEVSPGLDPANITAAAAAKLVREAVLLFGR